MPLKESYPWDEWFNGQEWLLVQGRDYENKTYSFSKYIYQKARERGVKVVQEVNDNSIRLAVKKNDNAVVLSSRKDSITNLATVVESNGNISPSVNKLAKLNISDSQVKEWLYELLFHGEIEVEEFVHDERGNQIPIMIERGGVSIPSGKFETRTVKKNVTPKEYITLSYPHDFTCSARKLAAMVCDYIKEKYPNEDVSKLYFDYSKKDKLTIYSGHLAERKFQEDLAPDNLLKTFNRKEAIPIPAAKLDDWKSRIDRDGQITLYKGRDYITDSWAVAGLFHMYYPDFEFYPKIEHELGMETLVITARKPMFGPMNKSTTLEQIKHMEEGKLLEQPDDLERERIKNEVKNIEVEKRKYIEKYTHLKKEIAKLENLNEDGMFDEDIAEVEGKVKQLGLDAVDIFNELLTSEEDESGDNYALAMEIIEELEKPVNLQLKQEEQKLLQNKLEEDEDEDEGNDNDNDE